MIPHLGWPATVVLAALLVWAPIPWGSSRPFFVYVLEMGALGALALAVLRPGGGRRLRPVALPCLLFGLFGVFSLLQTVPIPAWLARWLSPAHAALYESAAAAAPGVPAPWPRLSVAPALTWGAALWSLSLLATFLAAAVVSERRARRRVLLGAVVATALLEAAFGYQQWRAGIRTIWGVAVPQPPGRLRGTFVNPNHLAFYLGIALVITLAAIWMAAREHRRRARTTVVLQTSGAAAVWMALVVAIGMTGSRSGLLAAAAATVVQVAFLAWSSGQGRRRTALWVGGAAALAGLVAVLAGTGALARLLRTTGYEVVWNDRWVAYRSCLELWTRFPITGTGLATFREAFPMTQPAGLHEVWRHAHSDWLELLATTGLAGVLLMLAAIALLCRRLVGLQGDAKRSESRGAALAGLGALALAAGHSLLDFSLTMPADAFTLAAVLGSAAGAPMGRRRGSSGRQELSPGG